MIANEAEVRWNLEYSSNPPLQWIKLFDNHGNEVDLMTETDSDKRIEFRREHRNIIITIRDLSITDAGEYTLRANNSRMNTERKLKLRVRGK